ncbi:MAG: PilC/PilY family type IV pilus protein [Methylotenera sp.]
MKLLSNFQAKASLVFGMIFAASLTLSNIAAAAPVSVAVDLADAPLADSTLSKVLPNVFFILDDSTSMEWNYLPDWVDDNLCKATDGNYDEACDKQPPFRSPDINGVYYNPTITYDPPVNADKTSKASQTTWTSVKNDAYNIQDTGSTNLVTGYSDVVWCTDNTYTDCLRNDNYILPGTVVSPVTSTSQAYKTSRTGQFATGSGSVATGNLATPSTATRNFGPHYYKVTPGEYCNTAQLTNCQVTETATYKYPAKVRWCNSEANATTLQPASGACQAVRIDGEFDAIRYPTKFFQPATAAVPEVPYVPEVLRVNPTGLITFGGTITSATQTARINRDLGSSRTISMGSGGSTITVSNANPLNITGGNSRTPAQVASRVVSVIGTGGTVKAYIGGNAITPTCASKTANVVCLVDTSGTVTNGKAVSVGSRTNFGGVTVSTTATAGGVAFVAEVPYQAAIPAQDASYPGGFTRVDIVTGQTYTKVGGSSTRRDCAAETLCTYAEEMTNFANWWTYYQTRMQAMKTSVSHAFKNIGNRYRVGYTTISDKTATDGNDFQHIDTFEGTQKTTWYTKLFDADPRSPSNGIQFTPLRGALSKAGRLYGNKITGQADPMQYSCQQNFTILSTDGYWNTNNETASYGSIGLTGAAIGNKDGGPIDNDASDGLTTTREMLDTFNKSDTLADIAKYYFDTDLRTVALGNCTGAIVPPATAGNTLCANPVSPATTDAYNNVFVSKTDVNRAQHMTTFTLGLGMDGRVAYQKDYNDPDSVGDFDRLRDGTTPVVVWPDSIADAAESRVDDLWHAAVNGHGLYFSAKKPDDITEGLKAALDSIKTQIGAGAAAATSTLNPVAGEDNLAYVASYTTVQWTGNLEARSIDAGTGEVSKTALWCVETIPASDGVTPCTNSKMPGQVAAGTRNILMKDGSATSLVDFTYANMSASQKPFFEKTWLEANLSQWTDLPFSTAQETSAVGSNLVNYLRGATANEFSAANPDDAVFRTRVATLGDAVESQPAFIAKPTFNYIDAGYSAFKTANAGRAPTVYMGANDGMLHAFNATASLTEGGKERWAYVPSMVIPNMYALADADYSTNHVYYVNGSPIISDVTIGGVWKTILVGGLNGGGRGYYALDITDPADPKLLWEFTPNSTGGENLGYTYGNPVITKKANGDWVVLVTSGYNNIPDVKCTTVTPTKSPLGCVVNPQFTTGDGAGYLYVLDAATGAIVGSPIATGEGSTTTPSGLGQIAAWAEEPEKNNVATFIYGGDLKGNLWRFDINNGPTATKFATLGQPITTRPELGKVLAGGNVYRVVFVGTGKYLETDDLTDLSQQTLYAIKDDDVPGGTASPTFVDPRSSATMVEQVLTTASGGASRSVATTNPVDFNTDRGWFIDLQSGERQNVSAKLVQGTLIVPTTVPSNTVCAPGGTGWLNYFDYDTGGAVVGTQVSTFTNSPIVGINVVYVTDPVTGKASPKVSVVTADNPTPTLQPNTPFSSTGAGFQKKRVIWRELIQ